MGSSHMGTSHTVQGTSLTGSSLTVLSTSHTVQPPLLRQRVSSLPAPASPHPHLYQSIRQIKLFAKHRLRVCFIPALGEHDAAAAAVPFC